MASPWDAAALLVSVVALSVAIFTVWRSDRNASAATLVTLYEALRGAWGATFRLKVQSDEHSSLLS